jgi:hypothetical protein
MADAVEPIRHGVQQESPNEFFGSEPSHAEPLDTGAWRGKRFPMLGLVKANQMARGGFREDDVLHTPIVSLPFPMQSKSAISGAAYTAARSSLVYDNY